MSGYTVNRTRPDLPSMGSVVTSMTMNFESTRVAIGSATNNSNTGMVKVYDYNSALNTWVQIGINLVGNDVNAYFGCSIDMDWDGEILAVGAWGSRTLHIYTYNGSSWVSTTVVTKLTEADFGWAVSISKDTPNVIAASAPTGNNVYVYENLNVLGWSEVFKTNGDSVSNFVPNDRNGNNYILKPFTNRYGESIRLSGFGDHLIVGQPGTVLDELNSTNTDIVPSGAEFPTSVDPTYVLAGTPPVIGYVDPSSPYPSRFGTNINRQVGSVSVFKTSGSWLTSNTQVGTTLYYDNVDNVQTDTARMSEQIAWSYPGFGLSVDISLEGDTIMVGAPLYSVLGGDYTYHNGQIVTYKINEGFDWVKIDVVVGLKSTKYGSSLKMDYTGKRAVVTGCNRNNFIIDVLDWNGTSWFETQPLIIQVISPNTSSVIENASYMTNGTVAGLSIYDGSTQFYDHQLTQSILGNNLVSGYLATEQIFVGANDNTNISTGKFSTSKKISFGGTYYDNTYEGATIENRVYREYELGVSSGQQGEGRSELLIAKTSEERIGNPVFTGSGGIDLIRLKATEIYLDSYSLYDGIKYEHKPLLALNYQKNVSIGLPFLNAPAAFYFRSNTNAKAKLDVNGSTYVRNRLNVNVDGGNDILGVTFIPGAIREKGEQPLLLWDTRNGDSIVGSTITSNTLANHREVNILGQIISPVSYSSTERAFDLTGSGGSVYADVGTNSDYITVSLWAKLTILPTVDTLVYTRGNHLTVYFTSSGFKVHVGVSPGGVTYTYNYTFTLNNWVHVVSVYDKGTFSFYINGSIVSPASTSGTIPETLINQITRFTVYGGTGMFVGMVMVWGGLAFRGPTPLMLYNNGPPSEMLKVGGDAVVTGKLGVGVANPTNALEVVGDVTATTFSGSGASLTSLNAGNISTGTLPVTRGGTGVTTSTGTGSVVLNNSPLFTTTLGVNGVCRFGKGDGILNIDAIDNGFGPEILLLQVTLDGRTLSDPIAAYAPPERYQLALQPYAGRVAIGKTFADFMLDVNGALRCFGFTNSSDDRIKYNEQNISSNCLALIAQLKPQKYEKIMEVPKDARGMWIPTDAEWDHVKDNYTWSVEYGFVAQDVKKIPEFEILVHGEETVLVSEPSDSSNADTIHYTYVSDETSISEEMYTQLSSDQQALYTKEISGYSKNVETQNVLALDYNGIFVTAVGAIKELNDAFITEKRKVATLETQLTVLENQLISVLERLTALESP